MTTPDPVEAADLLAEMVGHLPRVVVTCNRWAKIAKQHPSLLPIKVRAEELRDAAEALQRTIVDLGGEER